MTAYYSMQRKKNGLSERPIGIFDSGLGGLTVFKEVRRMLPRENLVYFGDTARVPYGSKSPQAVKKFAAEIAAYLKSFNVKAIVVACNTVSSLALREVSDIAGVPVIGVIKPGAIEAAGACKNGRITVIGTSATVNSRAYERELRKINPSFKIKQKACPLFVPLVEEGWAEGKIAKEVIAEYLSEFRKSGPGTLILGCTHYPMLKKNISSFLPDYRIIDSAESVAKFLFEELSLRGLISKVGSGRSLFIVSDAPEKFRALAKKLLGIKIKSVKVKRF
ncbi:MAG: glutamate racemase [Elusimicrobiota bacterium]